jgi:hypothetical protein
MILDTTAQGSDLYESPIGLDDKHISYLLRFINDSELKPSLD